MSYYFEIKKKLKLTLKVNVEFFVTDSHKARLGCSLKIDRAQSPQL